MPQRPSAIVRAGLDAKAQQRSDGRTQLTLTDDTGNVVFDRHYNNLETARSMAGQWVREHYAVETEEVAKPKAAPKARPRTLGPQPSAMVQMMRDRADDNEEKAVAYRQQADGLEVEAKRLRVAADELAGPDA